MRDTQQLYCPAAALGLQLSRPAASVLPSPICRRPRPYRLGACRCGLWTAAAGAPWAAESSRLGRPYLGLALKGRQNLIYQPVLLGLLGRDELVPLHVPTYLILLLAGVHSNNSLHA